MMKQVNKEYLFQYDDEFERRLIDVARRVEDWNSVFEFFSLPLTDSIVASEKFCHCPSCRNSGIQLSLVAPRYPSWRCRNQCHVNVGGMNFVSLITLFDQRSPKEILDIVETRFARKVPAKKSTGKIRPVPSKKPNRVTPKKKTAPVSSRAYSHLEGALFPTKHPQKA
jgi:hypothetical protein